VTNTEVRRQPGRYELFVDGRLAGLAAYLDRDRQRIFHHTEVGHSFRGRGLSTVLIERALADARDTGWRIVPVCPAVAAFLDNHDGFADAVDPVTDDTLAWLDTASDRS
jgi:predicted GNAT family acetyltransferase